MLGSPWDMPPGLPKTVGQEPHGEGTEGIRDQGDPGSPDTGRPPLRAVCPVLPWRRTGTKLI